LSEINWLLTENVVCVYTDADQQKHFVKTTFSRCKLFAFWL